MAATIRDVAKAAGVNPSTVSRVINGTATITAETKERVYQAMESLDFHPNALARSLANGLSGTIGMVVDAQDAESFSNVFFSSSLFAVERVAQSQGYQVLISNGAQNQYHIVENLIKEHKVDGLILPPTTVNSKMMTAIKDFPYVVLGTPDTLRSDTCWVDNNNEQGAELAVRHLKDCGYSFCGYLGGHEKRGFTKRRVRGFLKSVERKEAVYATDGSWENAYRTVMEVLRAENHPDSFVCNDNMAAYGLLKACKELRLSVPQEIGIIAFDNYPLAEYTDPPLTIVNIDTTLLGEQSAQLLLRRIHEKIGNQQIMLSASIIPRRSTERKVP